MNAKTLRICAHFFPGGLVLVASAWLIAHRIAVPPSGSELVKFAPVAVFGVGLALSALFHRSRTFHALLLLAIANSVLWQGSRYFSAAAFDLLVNLIAILLPLNLVLISFLRETAIFSRRGALRVGFLALEIAVIAGVCHSYVAPASALLNRRLLLMLPFDTLRGFPHSVLTINAISSLSLMLPLVRRRFRPTDIGIFWALTASCVALSVTKSPQLMSIAFSAGAAVLVISLLETFYAMAYRDELTDLPSRRSFNDAKMKLGSTYTVAMVDVDHFKKFNDTYGHDAGDHVLRMVASRLTEITGGGRVFRYGGEEFAILFPGKQVDETFPHLERVRRSIEEIPFKIRGKDRRRARKNRERGREARASKQSKITVSIGAAGVAGIRRQADDTLKAADKALYRAKACGRNCTIVTETEFQSA